MLKAASDCGGPYSLGVRRALEKGGLMIMREGCWVRPRRQQTAPGCYGQLGSKLYEAESLPGSWRAQQSCEAKAVSVVVPEAGGPFSDTGRRLNCRHNRADSPLRPSTKRARSATNTAGFLRDSSELLPDLSSDGPQKSLP